MMSVAKLRGILHMKKIGHTGTLDPEAEGVLPVCLGKATGLCSMITDWGKTYEAVMLLGTTTDTQDTTGTVTAENEVHGHRIRGDRGVQQLCRRILPDTADVFGFKI